MAAPPPMCVIVIVGALPVTHGVVLRLAGGGRARKVARARLRGRAGRPLGLDQLDAPRRAAGRAAPSFPSCPRPSLPCIGGGLLLFGGRDQPNNA
eukprot:4951428-Lingulodinium_polyedra.AAC.1